MPQKMPDRAPIVASVAPRRGSRAPNSRAAMMRAADAFAFSSGLAATIGLSLSMLASRILDAPDAATWATLSAGGTFIIYNLDRLRDIGRDRAKSPLRTAFVLRHRNRLYAAVGIVAIAFAAILVEAPRPIGLLCLAIGLVGFFHRRLKQGAAWKAAYVSIAWVAACVGMPWLASGRGDAGPWLATILLASLAGNLIASNLRDDDGAFARRIAAGDSLVALWIARAMFMLAFAITLAAPAALLPLAWIPVCEGLALAYYQPTERYGHLAIDGGLLVGALIASIQLGWFG